MVLFGAVHAIIQRFRVGGVNAIKPLPKYPKVTIIVPAHNEAIVIQDTVYALLHLDYPKEAMEIRVVADNCSDETFKLATAGDRPEYKDFDIQIIKRTGTGGKAGVLNDVLEIATGDWICVYDADAMPQENALYFLIQKALEDERKLRGCFWPK